MMMGLRVVTLVIHLINFENDWMWWTKLTAQSLMSIIQLFIVVVTSVWIFSKSTYTFNEYISKTIDDYISNIGPRTMKVSFHDTKRHLGVLGVLSSIMTLVSITRTDVVSQTKTRTTFKHVVPRVRSLSAALRGVVVATMTLIIFEDARGKALIRATNDAIALTSAVA